MTKPDLRPITELWRESRDRYRNAWLSASRGRARARAQARVAALREAAKLADSHVRAAHPDCGPCAMAGVIAYELRVRAENEEAGRG